MRHGLSTKWTGGALRRRSGGYIGQLSRKILHRVDLRIIPLFQTCKAKGMVTSGQHNGFMFVPGKSLQANSTFRGFFEYLLDGSWIGFNFCQRFRLSSNPCYAFSHLINGNTVTFVDVPVLSLTILAAVVDHLTPATSTGRFLCLASFRIATYACLAFFPCIRHVILGLSIEDNLVFWWTVDGSCLRVVWNHVHRRSFHRPSSTDLFLVFLFIASRHVLALGKKDTLQVNPHCSSILGHSKNHLQQAWKIDDSWAACRWNTFHHTMMTFPSLHFISFCFSCGRFWVHCEQISYTKFWAQIELSSVVFFCCAGSFLGSQVSYHMFTVPYLAPQMFHTLLLTDISGQQVSCPNRWAPQARFLPWHDNHCTNWICDDLGREKSNKKECSQRTESTVYA